MSSSWTSFCLMVYRDGSRIVLVAWPLSVFQPDFRQLFSDEFWSDTDYLDLPVNCRGKHKSSFICFSSFTIWLYFKLTNTHIHGPLYIYFALPTFCVNLGCRKGLNMAVITGCYESHVSGALLPNVNDCRQRNFHDYHKKPIPRGEKRYMCTSAHIHLCVCGLYSILYM